MSIFKDELKRNRFYRAVESSHSRLKPFRQHRAKALKEYVGQNYSDDGTTYPVYLNMIQQAISIYTRQLAAREPAVMVTTKFPELKPAAKELSLATNHLIQEIKLLKTLRTMVVEALFSVGIVKVGMTMDGVDNFTQLDGQYYAEPVPLDDWVQDMSVARYDQVGFAGHRYRMRLDVAKEFEGFDKRRREELRPATCQGGGEDKASMLTQSSSGAQEADYVDYVDLYEIWLPEEGVIYTCEADESNLGLLTGKPLSAWDWTGPRRGPFHQLIFQQVPGNSMGLPPVANWRDPHELANQLMRKLADQAKRQKDILGYQGQNFEDAERAVSARDGQAVMMNGKDSLVPMKYGGFDQANLGFVLQLRDLHSAMAGNLDVLGGLSPQADTLGQERILKESASSQVDDMQDQVISVVGDICQDLSEYLFYDTQISLPITKRRSRGGPGVTSMWPIRDGVDRRDGEFTQYNFKIQEYSLAPETPASKLQTLDGFMARYVEPYIGMMEQQGIKLDFEGLHRTVAELTNMDELEQFLIYTGQPVMEREKPVTPQQTSSQGGSKTYEHVSRPGSTNQGRGQIMQNLMNGGNPQESEMAQLGQMGG